MQTFRISDPSSYARTILIEALLNEGIIVDTEAVTNKPTNLLPPKDSYVTETILAEYISLPFSQYGRLVLKPSYNIGSDTCLILWDCLGFT